jgi:hypothetical protein
LVTQKYSISVKATKKRTFQPNHSSIPSTGQFRKESPARTDSLAIEELSGFVSNLSLKRSAARFQGSEGRERFVSKNASRFPFPRLYWHTGNEKVFSPLDFEPASTHGPFRQLGDMTHGDIHRLSPYTNIP